MMTAIAGWLRYALQTVLYGFTYQMGQNLAEDHGKEKSVKDAGWPLVLLAVVWAAVVLAILAEAGKGGGG